MGTSFKMGGGEGVKNIIPCLPSLPLEVNHITEDLSQLKKDLSDCEEVVVWVEFTVKGLQQVSSTPRKRLGFMT